MRGRRPLPAGLNDRRSQAPLPLPNITQERLVTIVRHGESTWNAESRVQGSSDFSELTEKGMRQALATRDMVSPIPAAPSQAPATLASISVTHKAPAAALQGRVLHASCACLAAGTNELHTDVVQPS